MKRKPDWGKWERSLRKHRLFGPVVAFVLDDVDPKRPKYELVRLFAPLVLLALCVGAMFLAPPAFTILLVIAFVSLLLMMGPITHLLQFGLGRLSWIPWTAFALSVVCGLVALAWEPADTWGAILGLVFFLGALIGYLTAGIKLTALVIKQSRAS